MRLPRRATDIRHYCYSLYLSRSRSRLDPVTTVQSQLGRTLVRLKISSALDAAKAFKNCEAVLSYFAFIAMYLVCTWTFRPFSRLHSEFSRRLAVSFRTILNHHSLRALKHKIHTITCRMLQWNSLFSSSSKYRLRLHAFSEANETKLYICVCGMHSAFGDPNEKNEAKSVEQNKTK